MKKYKIAYYIVTVLFSIFILMGAIYDLGLPPAAMDLMIHLGYTAPYILIMISVAKILGIIGIWQNKVKFLREWAYAGLVIDLLGAVISHLASGDSLAYASGALIALIFCLASYTLLRKVYPERVA